MWIYEIEYAIMESKHMYEKEVIMSIYDTLNDMQREAVYHIDGPLLILKAVSLVLRWDLLLLSSYLLLLGLRRFLFQSHFWVLRIHKQNCVTHFLNCRFFIFLMLTILNE